ncbi:DNA polymerase I, partial [Alkalibacillus haloalkaliphilus]|uniref:5'-3' exonuclease n=1 Tax=Alkalibacillus haloalkaliphilus TaxID=94136 RepID=UPI00058DC496
MSKELVLIDGNSILYRSFFALPLLSNDQGVHTNAVFGFTKMMLKVLDDHDPSHILVAFDAGKTTFRHETYKEYKGGRQKTPPELSEQFPIMRELLDAFGVKYYELDQYEADDIIGTMVKEADDQGQKTIVYSGDKDLLQLASNHTTVSLTRKGISEIDHFTPESIKEKMGISKEQIIDLKALMGDQSDN